MIDQVIHYLITKGFTMGESKVAARILQGKSNHDISAELFVSEKTTKFFCTKIYKKAGVKSRCEFMAKHLVLSPIVLLGKLDNNPVHDTNEGLN